MQQKLNKNTPFSYDIYNEDECDVHMTIKYIHIL